MSDDRADDAAARRRSAELRAEELRGLRERLEGGDRLTPDDVALARRRLAEAEHLAQTAHDRAATAHEEAAERHRRAAAVAERSGHPDEAVAHRRAAEQELAAALADRRHGVLGVQGGEPVD